MKKIELASTQWSLSCNKEGFAPIPAALPGDNYTALLDNGIIKDPNIGLNEDAAQWPREYDWTWKRTFQLSADVLAEKRIWLNIDSLDTVGTVRINGQEAVKSEDMFLRVRKDVKEFLREGENEIEIFILAPEKYIEEAKKNFRLYIWPGPGDPSHHVSNIRHIRKVQCHGGWDWGLCIPVSGVNGDISLGASDGARLEHLHTEQVLQDNKAKLTVIAEIDSICALEKEIVWTFNGETKRVNASLVPGKNTVTAEFLVENPALWYPNGYGEQALYPLVTEFDGIVKTKRIGFRTVENIRQPDSKGGTSFFFRVNGIDIFAKGANWIPLDSRPQTFSRERYEQYVRDSVEVGMNMIRVWGGGYYENEDFYDLCDEYGLLVWQDFMFACAVYRDDRPFLELISQEGEYQIKRLKDHPSIALWCGDNECAGYHFWLLEDHKLIPWVIAHDRVNRTMGEQVYQHDRSRLYWPSSPAAIPEDASDAEKEEKGDIHYWDVWHGGKGFDAYQKILPRFCSEFGYQSFPCQDTVDRFLDGIPHRNVTAPTMEFHQRNGSGNSKIVEMFTRYFRQPEGFENFIYLSQVQQSVAMKTGIEYWRSCKPICMGTLYWQLNDNWPVASWSSIDYYGNWKQMHYHARHFFAPVIVTGFLNQDKRLEVRAVSDVNAPFNGKAKLELFDFSGNLLQTKELNVELNAMEAKAILCCEVKEFTADPAAAFLHVTITGTADGREYANENDIFFTEYKKCELEDGAITAKIISANEIELSASKPAFFVFAEFRGTRTIFSDNSVTLLPGRPRRITFRQDAPQDIAALEQSLEVRDLYRSYNRI